MLFVEWLYLRTGDELYRTLAKRWTKMMAALFAAGVVTGTILSDSTHNPLIRAIREPNDHIGAGSCVVTVQPRSTTASP